MKVHRRDVKKIPMTDKICQMYEEEQVNKIRNGRKLVPDSKMPNLSWNLEKQETLHKEDIQEIEETNNQNRTLQMYLHLQLHPTNSRHSFPVHKNSSRSSKTSNKNNRGL